MSRFTKRNSLGEIERVCNFGKESGESCFSCESRAKCNAAILERLAELEDKLEKKLAFELPCHLGGTLWRVCNHDRKHPSYFIRSVELNMNNLYRVVFRGEFGETVFLTKEEATEAMNKMAAMNNLIDKRRN